MGDEYITNSLKGFCKKNDIVHEFTTPYTPQQNGIIERKNKILKDMMNVMIINSSMLVPHKKLNKTSYELWKGRPPNLNYLKVWGCLAKVGLLDFKRTNIGLITIDAVFIGYAQDSVAFRFMSLNNNYILES
ncbi:hypothetical protein CR513_39152, partial [Mucuna pruriens]